MQDKVAHGPYFNEDTEGENESRSWKYFLSDRACGFGVNKIDWLAL